MLHPVSFNSIIVNEEFIINHPLPLESRRDASLHFRWSHYSFHGETLLYAKKWFRRSIKVIQKMTPRMCEREHFTDGPPLVFKGRTTWSTKIQSRMEFVAWQRQSQILNHSKSRITTSFIAHKWMSESPNIPKEKRFRAIGPGQRWLIYPFRQNVRTEFDVKISFYSHLHHNCIFLYIKLLFFLFQFTINVAIK